MLNVLIAIMMETFSRINDAAEIYNHKVILSTISELEVSFLPEEFRENDSPFKILVIKRAFDFNFENNPILQ